ncbi:MAG: VOC family protein [Actinomycetota bacterium]|nr:VOC family protein [Actinomycetota bacterium]
MLGACDLVAFVGTTDSRRAAEFYGGTLGLPLREESAYALVFDANGTTLRVAIMRELSPAPYTVLGWAVSDIVAVMTELAQRGTHGEYFDVLEQDERAVWTTPSGDRVAWFKDPDGNLLSVTELRASRSDT